MDNSNDKARSPSSFLRGLEGPRVMKATTTDGGGEGKRSPYLFNSSPRPYKPPRATASSTIKAPSPIIAPVSVSSPSAHPPPPPPPKMQSPSPPRNESLKSSRGPPDASAAPSFPSFPPPLPSQAASKGGGSPLRAAPPVLSDVERTRTPQKRKEEKEAILGLDDLIQELEEAKGGPGKSSTKVSKGRASAASGEGVKVLSAAGSGPHAKRMSSSSSSSSSSEGERSASQSPVIQRAARESRSRSRSNSPTGSRSRSGTMSPPPPPPPAIEDGWVRAGEAAQDEPIPPPPPEMSSSDDEEEQSYRKASAASSASSRPSVASRTDSVGFNVQEEEESRRKESVQTTSEDQVDALTSQMVEALETNETVKWSADIKNPSNLGRCAECGLDIEREASVVGSLRYHPGCFRCEECQKPLGAEPYFVIKGKNYCAQDRDKFLDKCAGCSQPIVGDTVRPKETGQAYHPRCFCCSRCSAEIRGKYFQLDGGAIVCEEDYLASRDKCARCRGPVTGTVLQALGGSFHPGCFTCARCPANLDGVQFYLAGPEEKDPLCQECYASHVAKRCDGCKQPIVEDCLVSQNTGEYYHKTCYSR